MQKKTLKRDGEIQDYYAIDEDSFLGEGGSGIVRRGIKRDTGESFAIKIIDK